MSALEEKLLWQIAAFELPKPEREHVFAPPRRWRFDMAWPDLRVALEVEGGIWVSGGHVRGADYERNCEKYNEAALLGWTVLRVTSGMIHDGRAIETLTRALRRDHETGSRGDLAGQDHHRDQPVRDP